MNNIFDSSLYSKIILKNQRFTLSIGIVHKKYFKFIIVLKANF